MPRLGKGSETAFSSLPSPTEFGRNERSPRGGHTHRQIPLTLPYSYLPLVYVRGPTPASPLRSATDFADQ